MRVLKRLLYEFWLPLLCGILWTCYRAYFSESTISIGDLIANFATSFFLASWMFGQIHRVRKDIAFKDSFGTLETKMDQIEAKTIALLEQTKDIPAVNLLARDLAAAAQSATKELRDRLYRGGSSFDQIWSGQPLGSPRVLLDSLKADENK